MELERNYDEFFAIRAQKFVTKASRSVRTASNNLEQINTDGYPQVTRNIVRSLEANLHNAYRMIMEVEAELIELRRTLML